MSENTNTLQGHLTLFETVLPVEAEHHRVKGRRPRNADKDVPVPEVDIIKLSIPDIDSLITIVGNGDTETGEKLVFGKLLEVVKEASFEASKKAFKDGVFNPVTFETSFLEEWQAATRRGRVSKAELYAKLQEYADELVQILQRSMSGQLMPEDNNRVAFLSQKMAELRQKLEPAPAA